MLFFPDSLNATRNKRGRWNGRWRQIRERKKDITKDRKKERKREVTCLSKTGVLVGAAVLTD